MHTATGIVYLVGAGPGDPGLLTVRALETMTAADVVVYDRLVSAAVLERIPAGVAKVYVGKAAGHHHATQSDINDMLVRLARAGHTVVRLKGGDPFTFGRGGEEALALREASVPFEVVPGITAATACAAHAGIPLTHRGLSRGVALVAGHCREGEPFDLDWESLADEHLTVAVYMGLANIAALREGLLGVGRCAHTPVALIESGSTQAQRISTGTLGELVELVERVGARPPCLLIVGKVVELASLIGSTCVDTVVEAAPAAKGFGPY